MICRWLLRTIISDKPNVAVAGFSRTISNGRGRLPLLFSAEKDMPHLHQQLSVHGALSARHIPYRTVYLVDNYRMSCLGSFGNLLEAVVFCLNVIKDAVSLFSAPNSIP